MAARRRPVAPGIGLAARLPLPRYPPAPDFLGTGRILQIEDHHDIADIAFGSGRDIGVAAVKIVAVHPFAVGAPFADQMRPRRRRHVVDSEAAAEPGIAVLALPLMVDDHNAVGDAHLVRMPADGHIDAGQRDRVGGIRHIDDRRTGRLTHVADVQSAAVNPDLSAARAVDVRNQTRVLGPCHFSFASRP
jgi:hypothetical protein